MPRYDLMHWSQRVRDQQAAASANAIPVASPAPVAPVRQAYQRRPPRPKPPKDEEAEELLRLCHEGRLFELQARVAVGRPLTVPSHYRRTPLRVALDTGFHSLIEFLLQLEVRQEAKDDLLKQACWNGQHAVIHLALKYGARVDAISFQDVIETWNRELARQFLQEGADPIGNAPFARAFKQRVKAALGVFLDAKQLRPDLVDALQAQADMALRQACENDDLKWVSLLIWLGANARTKGLATDDLDDRDIFTDPTYQRSALQIACGSKNPRLLRTLKPDPTIDDLSELMAAAGSFMTTPETLAYLVSLGANINDKADGGSTVLNTCLRHFGWNETVLDVPYGTYRHRSVPVARLSKSLEALRFVLNQGARWTPDDGSIAEVRRALYRVEGEAICAVVDLLAAHHACDEVVVKALLRTEKMRSIVGAFRRQQAAASVGQPPMNKRGAESKERATARTRRPSHFLLSRYDRQRLYDEVWAEPTQKVARRYGVSDVAISKACAALAIPKPPRGYWAKKAAGQKLPPRPTLPRMS